MSYHNASVPLADCTAQAMQDANQSRAHRKAQLHAHSQAPAVVLPKSFSHNPYVGVIPGSVEEMMRILEERRREQTAMRRTFSSPNFFNTKLSSPPAGGNSPLSPMQGGSPINQFPRVPSAPMFFEEPEHVLSRSTSPMMPQGPSFADASATSFGGSFGEFMQSAGNSPMMHNNHNTNQNHQQQQQPAPRKSKKQKVNAAATGPSERRQQQQVAQNQNQSQSPMELPVPASVARQQAAIQSQANKQAIIVNNNTKPKSPTTTAGQQPANSSANSSTDSANVITKVYQNGRPVPRMVEESSGEMVEIPRPKVLAEVTHNNVVVTISFRKRSNGNFRSSRLHLCAGDYVLVDGDRGCDLGQVLCLAEGIEKATAENTAGSIQRTATDEEIEKYHSLEADEAKALEFARLQVTRHLPGKITVEHVVFQFDHQKLTLWYKAAERVYFVPLLKALNQEYKCRIWMERIECEGDDLSNPVTADKPKHDKKKGNNNNNNATSEQQKKEGDVKKQQQQ